MFRREILGLEGLARLDAHPGEPGPDILVLRRWWDELEGEREILVEVLLDRLTRGREEIDLRRGWRCRLFEESGKGPRLVARLHLFHVRHVVAIEELGSIDGERERGRRGKDRLDPCRRRAVPARADDEIVAGIAPRGAAADVAEVVGIAVGQLYRVVALLRHRGHREHHRLRAQIHERHRVRCVAVRRDDRRVFVGRDTAHVVDLVEWRLELAGLRVHGVLVHHCVVHHDRQPVDEAFLGDLLRLIYAERGVSHVRYGAQHGEGGGHHDPSQGSRPHRVFLPARLAIPMSLPRAGQRSEVTGRWSRHLATSRGSRRSAYNRST